MNEEQRLLLTKNIAFYLGMPLVNAHKKGRMPSTADCVLAAELALRAIDECGYTLHRGEQAAIAVGPE